MRRHSAVRHNTSMSTHDSGECLPPWPTQNAEEGCGWEAPDDAIESLHSRLGFDALLLLADPEFLNTSMRPEELSQLLLNANKVGDKELSGSIVRHSYTLSVAIRLTEVSLRLPMFRGCHTDKTLFVTFSPAHNVSRLPCGAHIQGAVQWHHVCIPYLGMSYTAVNKQIQYVRQQSCAAVPPYNLDTDTSLFQ